MNARQLGLVALCILFAALSMANETGEEVDKKQEAVSIAEEIAAEIKEFYSEIADSGYLEHAVIRTSCIVHSSPFFEADHLTYPGCFLTCEILDYCNFFTYRESDAQCSFYHHPEYKWKHNSDLYCWVKYPETA